eukprot:TRINITY_DN7538_c0_g1_i2.p1 TRINITY_DN7538_c0_g1~~TRINITY_DN7538_c0_g1_i2.p1  ORF type:complete len:381 (+),score=66.52 TRINITY_DN7538_c0_g1_i2:111-1253(+)
MSNATSLFGALGSRRRDSSTHTTGQDAEEVVSGKRKRRSPSPEELGHYTINPGESIGRGRYKVLSKLGEGTFGMVAECWDRDRKRYCAVKIVRSEKKYLEAAEYEIDVLDDIRKSDPEDKSNCVHMWSTFHHGLHLCITFEPLGMSLYDFMKANSFQPFPIDCIRSIGRQVLRAVEFLNSLKLTHTDLKPENILFVSNEYTVEKIKGKDVRVPRSTRIKVIDFGNATYEKDHHSSIVCTRHYRPPEVLLGIKWNFTCDVWSIGCILAEMFIGDVLFQTKDDREHLAMMERVIGPLPTSLCRRADSHSKKYFKDNRLDWPDIARTPQSARTVDQLQPLERLVLDSPDEFVDAVRSMLVHDLDERPLARHCLRHPFFRTDSS